MSGQAWAPQAGQLPLQGPAKVCPQNQPWTRGVGAPEAREGGWSLGLCSGFWAFGEGHPAGWSWGQDPGRRAGAGETRGLQEARGGSAQHPLSPPGHP